MRTNLFRATIGGIALLATFLLFINFTHQSIPSPETPAVFTEAWGVNVRDIGVPNWDEIVPPLELKPIPELEIETLQVIAFGNVDSDDILGIDIYNTQTLRGITFKGMSIHSTDAFHDGRSVFLIGNNNKSVYSLIIENDIEHSNLQSLSQLELIPTQDFYKVNFYSHDPVYIDERWLEFLQPVLTPTQTISTHLYSNSGEQVVPSPLNVSNRSGLPTQSSDAYLLTNSPDYISLQNKVESLSKDLGEIHGLIIADPSRALTLSQLKSDIEIIKDTHNYNIELIKQYREDLKEAYEQRLKLLEEEQDTFNTAQENRIAALEEKYRLMEQHTNQVISFSSGLLNGVYGALFTIVAMVIMAIFPQSRSLLVNAYNYLEEKTSTAHLPAKDLAEPDAVTSEQTKLDDEASI